MTRFEYRPDPSNPGVSLPFTGERPGGVYLLIGSRRSPMFACDGKLAHVLIFDKDDGGEEEIHITYDDRGNSVVEWVSDPETREMWIAGNLIIRRGTLQAA